MARARALILGACALIALIGTLIATGVILASWGWLLWQVAHGQG
jgi:hypothetical protein